MDFDVINRLLKALGEYGVEYVLVGGVAINIHGITRATEDIDLFLRPTKENIERTKQALRAVWDDPEIEQIRYEDLADEYPTIRYGPPSEDFVVDLITRLGEAFRYEDLSAETSVWNGINVRVATPLTLYKMKKDTLRPIDHADAAELRERFQFGED